MSDAFPRSFASAVARPPRRARARLGVGLPATGAILFAHARHYCFRTDDAVVSFRYARNLANGAGLAFTPGYERVEGYTNFLWVLILRVFSTTGVPLDSAAAGIALCTAGLLAVVSWFILRERLARAAPGAGGAGIRPVGRVPS